jgi:heme A synthase
MRQKMTGFAKYAWAVLAYNILVIVYGAFVRATGSGAGCGAHWPLCNGVVIPTAPAIETVIEFFHRASSGITLILIAILLVWAWRIYPKGSLMRWSSGFTAGFIITESLLGAGLVLFDLVEKNASLTRAFSMMLHLVNTFLFLASITLTALWATIGSPKKISPSKKLNWVIAIGVIGMFLLGASGSLAALGDTLFPSSSLTEGFQQDLAGTANILLKLRVFHPFIAIIVGSYLAALASWTRNSATHPAIKRVATVLIGLVGVQFVLGITNVALLAPVWIQLVHLLVTTLIWIAFVLMSVLSLVPSDFSDTVSDHEIDHRIYQSPTQQSDQSVIK